MDEIHNYRRSLFNYMPKETVTYQRHIEIITISDGQEEKILI